MIVPQMLMLFVFLPFAVSYDGKPKIAILSEVEPTANSKREINLLPDALNVNLNTENDVIELELTRTTANIDPKKIDITFDDPTMHVNLNKKTIGYYQDMKKMAAIYVEANVDGVTIKRTLTGSLLHGGKIYELHPVSKSLQSLDDILEDRGLGEEHAHMIHLLREVDKEQLNPDKFAKLYRPNERKPTKDNNKSQEKRKTSPEVYHVELMFIIDYDVYIDFKTDYLADYLEQLVYHYVHILNGMYLAYSSIDPSSGIRIVLWLSKLHIITNPANRLVKDSNMLTTQKGIVYNADEVLDNTKDFTAAGGYTDNYPDHFMVWTRRKLWSGGSILGIAWTCAMCNAQQSHSLQRDNGVISWHTAAHEMAHTMGAEHDEPGHCGEKDANKYIMYFKDYAIDATNLNTAFTFSRCSISDMKKCISATGKYRSSYEKSCLTNTVCDHHKPLTDIDVLPGEKFDLEMQCQLYQGLDTSEYCGDETDNICQSVPCRKTTNAGCYYTLLRASAGTPCDKNNPNKVCYFGKCIPRSSIPSSKIDDAVCNVPAPTPTPAPSPTNGGPSISPLTCHDIYGSVYTECPNNASECIETNWFCDGENDCNPGVGESGDESPEFCGPLLGMEVPVHYCVDTLEEKGVRCPNDPEMCLPFYWVCDGENDCPDGADKDWTFCRKVPAPLQNAIRCHDDPTIYTKMNKYFKDGWDCGTEHNSYWFINAPRNCGDYSLNCPNNQSQCIPEWWACDGTEDCDAEVWQVSDETPEFCDCGPGQARCKGQYRQCIKNSWVFDPAHKNHCDDGSDEDLNYLDEWCNDLPPRTCTGNETQCPYCPFLPCIQEDWLCDYEFDCEDQSDELVCSDKKNINDKRNKKDIVLTKLDKVVTKLENAKQFEEEDQSGGIRNSKMQKPHEFIDEEDINTDRFADAKILKEEKLVKMKALQEQNPSFKKLTKKMTHG